MPQADDLFRPTAVPDPPPDPPDIHVVEVGETAPPAPVGKPKQASKGKRARQTPEKVHSGRVKHDEKMTVYVTSDELLDLEHARLTLRRALGTSVDRGRLVRAAVALALEDLAVHGEDSALVHRLTQA